MEVALVRLARENLRMKQHKNKPVHGACAGFVVHAVLFPFGVSKQSVSLRNLQIGGISRFKPLALVCEVVSGRGDILNHCFLAR